jgi:hypothetical protein
MPLSVVTRDEAVTRLAQGHQSEPNSVEVLCDVLRAEVHARKHAPRAATLSRVARLLAPAITVDDDRLDEACDALEREGDVLLNPGGILYATPTRVVPVERHARVFSSVPTRTLSKALGADISARGASRLVAPVDGLSDAVATVGGVIVTPEAWSGLDRSPKADAAFLSRLDQRLEWHSMAAGSLERDGAVEWRSWQVTPESARWQWREEGRLWWARTRFAGHRRAWTAGASPAASLFITLSPEEADRARFALSRDTASASGLRVVRSETRATIEVPGWLPRPEYRWLSLHAVPLPNTRGLGWEVPVDALDGVVALLCDRLGLAPKER